MKYSVKKLSEMTGYSQATVSNALNNKKGVNKETAEQIVRVARDVGYINGTKISNIKFVMYRRNGLVLADSPFFSALMETVERACREAGYDTIIYNINANRSDYQARLDEIVNDSTAGVLLLATELTAEDMKIFETAACPIVVLDAWFDSMMFDTVLVNNEDSVKMAVNYLVKNGHREIGYLSGRIRTRNFIDRGTGYRKALTENKLTVDKANKVMLTPTMDGAYKEMCEYLGTAPKIPTAYFADNDLIAFGAMKALRHFGYKIPQDVSIIGFDDFPFCEISSPPLTTIKFFQTEMGRLAVERLISKIKSKKTINCKIQISTQLIIRESVRDLKQFPL